MIAGPNGSGKTSLIRNVLATKEVPLGRYVNADDIERSFHDAGELNLSFFGVASTSAELKNFIKSHPLGKSIVRNSISMRRNTLFVGKLGASGYLAAILADYLRRKWIAAAESFTFETVMSSDDKVRLLKEAQKLGYRTYIYYVCTDSPLINRKRVEARVKQGGHPVPANKIISRYLRSLALLPQAIQHSDRAYIFDNSGKAHRLIAEYQSGNLIAAARSLPSWFANALLK